MPNPTLPRPQVSTEVLTSLVQLGVPLGGLDCEGCSSDPLDEEEEEEGLEYPDGWEVDYEEVLLGTMHECSSKSLFILVCIQKL